MVRCASVGGRRIGPALVFGALMMLTIAALPSPAAAQTKLASGFYYPVTAYWPVYCSSYLERDAAHGGCYTTGYYHLGTDLVSPLGTPVFALAAGTVVGIQTGWGMGTVGWNNVAVLIRHTLSDGSQFTAVYGHVISSLKVGDTVLAGAPIATIGALPLPTMTHVHLGIIPGTTIPSAYLGNIPNAYWPSTNSFTDPIQWLTTRSPATSSTARLSVSVNGGGVVSSVQPGISCGAGAAACAANYLTGTSVTLVVTPSAGWTFAGWSGSCSGTSGCVVGMTTAKSVSATFVPATVTVGSFQKTGPVNAGTRQSVAAILSWGAAANATSYEYCVDTTDNSACDGSWINVGTQTIAAPVGLAAGVPYFWQVRARNGTAVIDGDGGLWWRFTTRTSARFVCDVNYDGRADLVWQRSTDGLVAAWYMNGNTAIGAGVFTFDPAYGPSWKVVGVADFNADKACDLVLQNDADGRLVAWMMDGTERWGAFPLTPASSGDPDAQVKAVTDVNGDGYSDLIWQKGSTGQVSAWLMNGMTRTGVLNYSPQQETDLGWKVSAAGDMNEDGYSDLVWQHEQTGAVLVWVMRGSIRQESRSLSSAPQAGWVLRSIGDTNWDARPELFWQNPITGGLTAWFVQNLFVSQTLSLWPSANTDKTWRLVGPR